MCTGLCMTTIYQMTFVLCHLALCKTMNCRPLNRLYQEKGLLSVIVIRVSREPSKLTRDNWLDLEV
jgi:hypothetical protein